MFESLFSWVPELLKWLLSWLVWGSRLPVHEGGVKISGGKVKELKPGWYFWCPRYSEIFTDNVKRKVIELPEQLLTTREGKRVRAGGVLVYSITNIITWMIDNDEPTEGVQVASSQVLRGWVKSREFNEVQQFDPKKRVEDDLTVKAQHDMGKKFGIRVEQLSLASFAETNSTDLHHSGSGGVALVEE